MVAGGVLIATQDAHVYAPEILHRRYLGLPWPGVTLHGFARG